MTDPEFLNWMADRLEKHLRYRDNVIRLREIAKKIKRMEEKHAGLIQDFYELWKKHKDTK